MQNLCFPNQTVSNSTFYFDGSSWTNVIGGDGMDNWIDNNDPLMFIGSSQYGSFARTNDGGASFKQLNITYKMSEWTTPIIGDYSNGRLYTGFGNVYKSLNKGDTWKVISNFPDDFNSGYLTEISALAVALSNPDILYVTKRPRYEYQIKGSCYLTSDGGATWEDITKGLPDSLYFTSVEVSTSNANIAWITCAGLSDGNKVFKTTDGGLNWQNISYDLPNLPVNVVKPIPGSSNNEILIGNDLGIYFINDSSYSWTSYNNGLPNVIVSDIEFNPAKDKIYVSTFGRGIWESNLSDIVSNISVQTNRTNFNIFPSPLGLNQNFNVEFDNEYLGIVELKMYDARGRIILNTELNKTSYSFSHKLISPKTTGVYWIEIDFGKSSSKSEIIVR